MNLLFLLLMWNWTAGVSLRCLSDTYHYSTCKRSWFLEAAGGYAWHLLVRVKFGFTLISYDFIDFKSSVSTVVCNQSLPGQGEGCLWKLWMRQGRKRGAGLDLGGQNRAKRCRWKVCCFNPLGAMQKDSCCFNEGLFQTRLFMQWNSESWQNFWVEPLEFARRGCRSRILCQTWSSSALGWCSGQPTLQAWCMVEICRYKPMFQHANPVEVPYKAGFRILILTECHKEAHKGNAGMPLAITLRMPFLIHLQKVESLSAGVTTEEVKVEGCTEGEDLRCLPGVFTVSTIFQQSLRDFAEISQLCFIWADILQLCFGRWLVWTRSSSQWSWAAECWCGPNAKGTI